ncbi:MAG: hypothetical protein AAFP90_11540, partial [Planctomycetota bacterium]
ARLIGREIGCRHCGSEFVAADTDGVADPVVSKTRIDESEEVFRRVGDLLGIEIAAPNTSIG